LATDPKAVVYLPAAIAVQTISANATVVVTKSVPFQFKGNGPVEASFPFGQLFQNSTGQPSLGETWLTQATSYAGKTNPSVNFRLINSSAASAAITSASDLVISQF
jgi:hypothetical protein